MAELCARAVQLIKKQNVSKLANHESSQQMHKWNGMEYTEILLFGYNSAIRAPNESQPFLCMTQSNATWWPGRLVQQVTCSSQCDDNLNLALGL